MFNKKDIEPVDKGWESKTARAKVVAKEIFGDEKYYKRVLGIHYRFHRDMRKRGWENPATVESKRGFGENVKVAPKKEINKKNGQS
jgi:hypothetical protein